MAERKYTRKEISEMRYQRKVPKRIASLANRYEKRQIVYEKRYQENLARYVRQNIL